jgi:ribonuclease BN (tRNA processing enzyme)
VQLTVLGPHGGELPGCRSTCFLVDERLALDAGALTSTLPLSKLVSIDDVLLTHSHFDHIKDLPLLADLLVGRRDRPVTIWANTGCIRALREHVLNNEVWPDFTRIPSKKNPVFRLKSFRSGASFKIGDFFVKSIPVSHPVESCGFVISDGSSAMAISGDTGPTDKFWRVLNATENLKLLLVETSFPNELQALADVSGHYTPQTVAADLEKFEKKDCEVLLYHLKPAFLDVLYREVSGLAAHVCREGEVFTF